MNFDLKKFLKEIKLNEENISMVLGALVIVVVGILIVNYFKDRKGQTLPEALSTTNQVQTQTEKTHTIVRGETLWSVAEDSYGSGYNWTDIYNANNLKSQNVEIGQVLKIPHVAAKQPTATRQSATIKAGSVNQTITGNTYTVVHGDSLWNISVRAYGDGYQWVKIAKANNLKNPGIIHAGNILTLPR